MRHLTYRPLTVYYYEIYKGGPKPVATEAAFFSTLKAINFARDLKKEHGANKVRVENGRTGKYYYI